MNLSFAGCGFLGIYHVGVVSCFREYAPNLVNRLSGASAGAIAACALLCDCPLGLMTSEVLKVASSARGYILGPFSPKFDVCGILYDRLATVLPPDCHQRCSGRLRISVTRVSDGKNVILTEFNSKEEVIQALMCSSFIPMFSGFIPPTFRGVRYIDGCYSDNLPLLDENTVTVSPFCGECDICPRDNSYNLLQVNLANTSIELSAQNLYRFMRVLFPPHPEILSQMCKQGFDDALNFLQRNDLISCTRCIEVQSTLQLHETRIQIPPDSDGETTDEETESDNNCKDCKDCKHRKQVALLEDLPEAVLTVLEDACKSMNTGLINWVFRHKSMRIFSVLTLPYVLPLDIAYVMCYKILHLVPKLGSDVRKSFSNLMAYVKALIARLSKNRHFYSAKLTCQLALTEYDFEMDGLPAKSTSVRATNGLPTLDDIASGRMSMERVLGRVNVGFTVDMGNGNPKTDQHPLLHDRGGPLSSALGADSRERTAVEILNAALEMESHKPEDWDTHVDSFEQILEVTRRHDALMAYYYLDEHNRMKVTEIFDVTHADTSALLPPEEQELNHNLCWDEDWNAMDDDTIQDDQTWLPPSSINESQIDSVLEGSYDDDDIDDIESSYEKLCDSVFTDDGFYSLTNVKIEPKEDQETYFVVDR